MTTAARHSQIEESAQSAALVVPIICGLFPWVRSVVDVGCGTGVWLHEFRMRGVPTVLGLDGADPMDGLLHIEPSEFQRADLSKPFQVRGRFDLAMSLEVAQQLPRTSARDFVASLAQLSDVIVFGAAIPGQGGEHHIHERWPGYWAALFEANGFVSFDVLRDILWYDERVEWWYAQNTLVFVNKARTDLVADLQPKSALHRRPLDIVHPRCFEHYRAVADRISAVLAEQASAESSRDSLAAQLAASSAQLAASEERNAALTAQAAASAERNAALTAQLAAIHQSTSWRATTTLRSILNRSPRLRRILRASLKLLWWTVTGRLPSKIQEWVRSKTGAV